MPSINVCGRTIDDSSDCYFIAEIGHNHQGSMLKAIEMIETAARCGVDAVKFQKRDSKALFTKKMYNRIYDNQNSFGETYGLHRDFLEFGKDEYLKLKDCAKANNVDFICTAFDFQSVDFLEDIGVECYKVASADITNLPMIEYIAKLKKTLLISTGACTIEEIRLVYKTVKKYHDNICLFHCVCSYPTEYSDLNLRMIETLKKEFPDTIIGYSGHDNGVLAPVLAYTHGARIIEKHFTLNRAWKGTDHKFSLEPIGLTKQIRDLKRIKMASGDGIKKLHGYEISARDKMGKSLYASKDLTKGQTLSRDDIVIKSPAGGIPPYKIDRLVGNVLLVDMAEENLFGIEHFEDKLESVSQERLYEEALPVGI